MSNFAFFIETLLSGYKYNKNSHRFTKITNNIKITFATINNLKFLIYFFNKIKKTSNHIPNTTRQDLVGFLISPYICKEWDIHTRYNTILSHYEITDKAPRYLRTTNSDQENILINLSHVSSNARLVLDKPIWFLREGELVINLFKDDTRVMSIAFTIGFNGSNVVLYVGAIQGIHSGISSAESLDQIRSLTKDFEGLRPRSLLFYIIQSIAKSTNSKNIFAIREEYRQHLHPYFGNKKNNIEKANYNEIWEDLGGTKQENGYFYELPLTTPRKRIEDIPSKKRSMYKRRYEILDFIDKTFEDHLK